jgi:hypothetical protein
MTRFEADYLYFVNEVVRCGLQAHSYGHHKLSQAYAAVAVVMMDGLLPGGSLAEFVAPMRDALDHPFGSMGSDKRLAARFQALVDEVAVIDGVAV